MSDTNHQCNPNLPTPSPNAAETAERVDPDSTRRFSNLPVIPESIPEEINTLWLWVGREAEYRPDTGQKKAWSKIPETRETGPNARPTTSQTREAFDLAMASYSFVDRSLPWMLLVSYGGTEGLSRQRRAISVRGGLNHG